jgi:hypothetical protein
VVIDLILEISGLNIEWARIRTHSIDKLSPANTKHEIGERNNKLPD